MRPLEGERGSTYWCMPAILCSLFFILSFQFFLSFLFVFFLSICLFCCDYLPEITITLSPPLLYCARQGSFISCLSWLAFTILAFNYLCLVWVYLPTTTSSSVLVASLLLPDKEDYFVCSFAVAPLPTTVWVLSFYPSWHAPSDFNSSLLLLGGVSSQHDIFPKKAWAGTLE